MCDLLGKFDMAPVMLKIHGNQVDIVCGFIKDRELLPNEPKKV